MPQSLKLYIQFIEEYLEIPIKIISLGPKETKLLFDKISFGSNLVSEINLISSCSF